MSNDDSGRTRPEDEARNRPEFSRLGEWTLDDALYAEAAADPERLEQYHQRWAEVARFYYERKKRTEAGDKTPISLDDAATLVRLIKSAYLHEPDFSRDTLVAFLAMRCLTLVETCGADESRDESWVSVTIGLESTHPRLPGRCGVSFAVPAVITDAIGIYYGPWLRTRCEPLAREVAREGFPPGSPSARRFDGGAVSFTAFPEHRGAPCPLAPMAIPLSLARDEAAIAQCIEHAASRPEYWDAIKKVACILHQCGEDAGSTLRRYAFEVLADSVPRPSGTKGTRPKHVIHDHAIIRAVQEVQRDGLKATMNIVTMDNEPGRQDSACHVVAEEFGMTYRAVAAVWERRWKSLIPL